MTSNQRGDRVEGLLLDLILLAVGALLGLIGCFLIPLRLAGGTEGLAAGIALIGNFAAGLLGGLGARSVRSALAPGIGWFLVVAGVGVFQPGGDVVIAGKLPVDPGIVTVGLAFFLLGVLGVIAAIFATTLYTRRQDAPTHTE